METVCLDAKKSNVCGASIDSGGKAISRACRISGVGSYSEATGGGGGLKVFRYHVMFHVNGLQLQGS